MKVTIWDLDYYYAEEKVNCFNPDVMKISSYHKQLGDTINFVVCQDDIRRPYDIYYIIKENNSTPNPPMDFFLNSKIKWWGNAYRTRVKWKMSDAMLGCRPDYLLYPEYNTQLERAEHIRFFNNKAKLLPLYQDYHNSFKNKKLIITDSNMWYADEKDIIAALKRLDGVKNLYFLHEIKIQKILDNEDLKNTFMNLCFTPGANLKWIKIKPSDFERCLQFLIELKKKHKSVGIGPLTIDYSEHPQEHWTNKQAALEDFNRIKEIIIAAKRNKIQVKIRLPSSIADTPYYYLFSIIGEWTWHRFAKSSWLEFITRKFSRLVGESAIFYWSNPKKWHDEFRDLLRQTYTDKTFLLLKWGNSSVSEISVPFELWEKEFKYVI